VLTAYNESAAPLPAAAHAAWPDSLPSVQVKLRVKAAGILLLKLCSLSRKQDQMLNCTADTSNQ
jgi:hypothetical protein